MDKQIRHHGFLLPSRPKISDFEAVIQDYHAILYATMNLMIRRYEKDQDSPWIDMKFDVLKNQDYPVEDILRGPNTIYAWIQGRALEALAGFTVWLSPNKIPNASLLLEKIKAIQVKLLRRLSSVRSKNQGHVFFFMTKQGYPFVFSESNGVCPITLTSESPYNFSDLFCSKGMYAAGNVLGDSEARIRSKEYCLAVEKATWEGRFVSDQQQLDPTNPVTPIKGRISHGPLMIQIGTAALLAEYDRSRAAIDFGLKQIHYISQYYVNLHKKWDFLKSHDFVEFLDNEKNPYRRDNRIFSDPGHALEFVGLSLKFTHIARSLDSCDQKLADEIKKIEDVMPKILQRNFDNGFQAEPGGICKLFDLRSRQAINTDMPWWSLPETIRAALECWRICNDDEQRQNCLNIAGACHNAFVRNYILPGSNLMAIQNLDANGKPTHTIPATPDVDPGYHTCLCLLDILGVIVD